MKKIGLIMTEDSVPDWNGEAGIGKYFLGRFSMADDTLDYQVIHGVTGTLPKVEDFPVYSGFVLSGSHHSVNDPYQWVQNLEEFVRNVDMYNKENGNGPIKLLGICYGHQLIAKAFGGKVEAIKHPKKIIFGSEKIDLSEKMCSTAWFKDVFEDGKKTSRMMKLHGEEVSQLPSNATHVGQSESCNYEVLMYGGTMLSFQGHPELTTDKMADISKRLVSSGILNEELAAEGKQSFLKGDTDIMVKLAIRFLRS